MSAEIARLPTCYEDPWQREPRLLLVVLEEPQALWKKLLVACVCLWPLHQGAALQGSTAHV